MCHSQLSVPVSSERMSRICFHTEIATGMIERGVALFGARERQQESYDGIDIQLNMM